MKNSAEIQLAWQQRVMLLNDSNSTGSIWPQQVPGKKNPSVKEATSGIESSGSSKGQEDKSEDTTASNNGNNSERANDMQLSR